MRKKLNISTVLIMLLLFSTSVVFAETHGHGEKGEKKASMGMMQGGMMEGMMSKMMCGNPRSCMGCMKTYKLIKYAEQLGLSEGQVKKIKTIKMDAQKNQIRKQAEADILKIDKKALFMEDTVNLNAVKEKLQKIAEAEAELQYICIEAHEDAKNVLTDDQKTKLKELKKMHKKSKVQENMMKEGGMKEGKKKEHIH